MKGRTEKLVLGALMMGLIVVMTMIVRIPIPFTQGYVHLGDAMVFMTVMVMGRKAGALCAGAGSALADILGGMPMWAPWTLVVKGLMALFMGLIVDKSGGSKAGYILGCVLGGLWMAAGYYAAEGIMYGNWAAPAVGIPWNIGQFAVGGILAMILTAALCRTKVKSKFAYTL